MNKSFKHLPKDKRKKILLICDDIRVHSGVATVAKEIVVHTAHHFNWVQIGGALNNPEKGKVIDMNKSISEETGVPDASLTIYPTDGYGNSQLLFSIIERENPDALLHFTDPRFWAWMYQVEHDIRVKYNMPIFYYTIWDCPPIPHWNKPFYESCDLLMCISKQTKSLVEGALGEGNFRSIDNIKENDKPIVSYVPHGIPDDVFYPITPKDQEYNEVELFKHKILR